MWESGADDDDVLCDVTVVLLQLSEGSDRALCSYFFSFGLFCIYPHFCQSPETVSFKSFHFPGQTPCLPGGHLPPTEKHHLPSPPV